MDNNSLKVNCYSGYIYAERPKSFEWQGVKHEVEMIEKAWQEPGNRLFQLITKNNRRFRLCYDETEKQWSLIELVSS